MVGYDTELVAKLTSLDKPYTIHEVVYAFTYAALLQNNFNRVRTAKSMNISIRGLRNKISEMKYIGFVIPDGPLGSPKRKGLAGG